MFVRRSVGEEAEEECSAIVHRTPNGQNEGALVLYGEATDVDRW